MEGRGGEADVDLAGVEGGVVAVGVRRGAGGVAAREEVCETVSGVLRWLGLW